MEMFFFFSKSSLDLLLYQAEYEEEKNIAEEGHWEYYCKYIEQNFLSFFLSMQCVNRDHLAVVPLNVSQEVMAARGPLFVHWMRRK